MTARIRVVEEVCAGCVHELLDRGFTAYGIDVDSRIRRRRDSELEPSNRRQWSRRRRCAGPDDTAVIDRCRRLDVRSQLLPLFRYRFEP